MVPVAPLDRLVGSWTESQVVDAVPWWFWSRARIAYSRRADRILRRRWACVLRSASAVGPSRLTVCLKPGAACGRHHAKSELVSSVPLPATKWIAGRTRPFSENQALLSFPFFFLSLLTPLFASPVHGCIWGNCSNCFKNYSPLLVLRRSHID